MNQSDNNQSIFTSFVHKNFRWFWLASFASWLALNMQITARSWLILRLTDDSPFLLSIMTLAFALPMTFFSPITGALADRVSRKKLITISQFSNAVVIIILALLDYFDLVQYWHVVLIAFCNGSLMSLNMPSRQAMISDLVPENKLMNAISLSNTSNNLSRAFGPAIAGILIILIDTSGTFIAVSFTFLMSALIISIITYEKTKRNEKSKSFLNDIKAGMQYAFSNIELRMLFILMFIAVMFGFPYFVLIPAWAKEILGINADGLGYLLMSIGIGATVGTFGLAALGKSSKKGQILIFFGLLWGLSLATFAQTNEYLIALIFLFFIGLSSAAFMSLTMTLIQMKSATEFRGRTMSLAMMAFGLMPLSAVPFGILAEQIGTANSLTISGTLLFVLTLLYFSINKKIRRLN
ncbi:MAG: MFS transporter [Dehalococcoidia bacterium]